ncbi:MAG: hypothetical protein ACHP6H_07535 [Legionellales bacterium]
MTKKDFIALANAFIRSKPDNLSELDQWKYDRDSVSVICAQSSSAFNCERWLAYIDGECGPNGGKL